MKLPARQRAAVARKAANGSANGSAYSEAKATECEIAALRQAIEVHAAQIREHQFEICIAKQRIRELESA